MPNVPVAAVAISIHTLREEGDFSPSAGRALLDAFLSTPSARRVTDCSGYVCWVYNQFLSTPSARRVTFLALCDNL